jgi:hypothetical protein
METSLIEVEVTAEVAVVVEVVVVVVVTRKIGRKWFP